MEEGLGHVAEWALQTTGGAPCQRMVKGVSALDVSRMDEVQGSLRSSRWQRPYVTGQPGSQAMGLRHVTVSEPLFLSVRQG